MHKLSDKKIEFSGDNCNTNVGCAFGERTKDIFFNFK